MEPQIRNWILNELSHTRPEYADLPACPYAKPGLLNNSIYFWRADPQQPVFDSLREMAIALPGWEHTTACVYFEHSVTAHTLWRAVEQFDAQYPQYLAFVSDPEDWPGEPGGSTIAPPPCLIVNIHWAKAVADLRCTLWLSGYYRNWSRDELDSIDYLTNKVDNS